MREDLTARVTSLAATIGAHLNDDEKTAKAATPGPWTDWAMGSEGYLILREHGSLRERGRSRVARLGMKDWDADKADAAHIARNDPARVLRRVAATRSLIAAILKEGHDWNAGDEYYSCSQAEDPDPCPGEGGPGSGCSDPDRAGQPCDCGRDQRVGRLLTIIAAEWEDQPPE